MKHTLAIELIKEAIKDIEDKAENGGYYWRSRSTQLKTEIEQLEGTLKVLEELNNV